MNFKEIWAKVKGIWAKIERIWKTVKDLWIITVFCVILLSLFIVSLWFPWVGVVVAGFFTGLLIYFLVLEYKAELGE